MFKPCSVHGLQRGGSGCGISQRYLTQPSHQPPAGQTTNPATGVGPLSISTVHCERKRCIFCQLRRCQEELERSKGEAAGASVQISSLESQIQQTRSTLLSRESELQRLQASQPTPGQAFPHWYNAWINFCRFSVLIFLHLCEKLCSNRISPSEF